MTPVTLRVTPHTNQSRTITQPLNYAVTHPLTHLTRPGEPPRTPFKGARDPKREPPQNGAGRSGRVTRARVNVGAHGRSTTRLLRGAKRLHEGRALAHTSAALEKERTAAAGVFWYENWYRRLRAPLGWLHDLNLSAVRLPLVCG